MKEPGSSLAPYASRWQESRGRQIPNVSGDSTDWRADFQRDRDRIIHSGAFRRLKHKTQVFIYHEGDYFRTRLTHSLEVAQVARAVSRRLGLDEDLAEACSLAHDLGHPPFGHAGETELDQAMEKVGGFDHNEQTVRVVTRLEHCYAGFDGLNLTWETLEGVVKHNGPVPKKERRKTIADLDRAFIDQGVGEGMMLDSHAGMEAQIAAQADDIAYLAHDCDDGLRAGMLDPEAMLGQPLVGPILEDLQKNHKNLETSRLVYELRRRLIKLAVEDLVAETGRRLADLGPESADDVRRAGKPVVAFSKEVEGELKGLRDYLFKKVWRHYKVNRMTSKAKRVMRELFELFMGQPNTLPTDWQTLDGTRVEDLPDAEKARHIADYVAGMTDRYALMEHERLFDPGPILR